MRVCFILITAVATLSASSDALRVSADAVQVTRSLRAIPEVSNEYETEDDALEDEERGRFTNMKWRTDLLNEWNLKSQEKTNEIANRLVKRLKYLRERTKLLSN